MSNVDVLRNAYEAFARGDLPTVLDAMAPDIRWHEAEGNPYRPGGEPWIGPDAVVENLFTRLDSDWDAFEVHPESFHDAGDVVVVEARYSGTHAETGRDLDAQVCHVWTLEDGKVAKFQQYTDTGQLQDVMGARAAM